MSLSRPGFSIFLYYIEIDFAVNTFRVGIRFVWENLTAAISPNPFAFNNSFQNLFTVTANNYVTL